MMEKGEEGAYWNNGGPKVYSEEDLTSAIEAGVLPVETAIRVREHVARLRNVPAADEEYFRLISGFNDIFVVIACILLLVAVGGIGGMGSGRAGAACVAVVSWGLAEYFVRMRRMALPAIVLLLTFAGGVFGAAIGGERYYLTGGAAFIIPFGVTLLAAALHWWRFKVPITVACGAAATVGLLVSGLLYLFPPMKEHLAFMSFIGGVAVFFLAMWWDSRDVARQTRRSDVAFWLHLLAAPLLVHPVFLTLGIFDGDISFAKALIVLLLYTAIAFVSLCIDRRALMVSSLSYVVYTLAVLVEQYGTVNSAFLYASLVIGIVLLLLSAGWQKIRARGIARLPHSVRVKLPPVRA